MSPNNSEYIPEECIDSKMFENKKICWIRLWLLSNPQNSKKIPDSFYHLFHCVLRCAALSKAFKMSPIANMNMNELVWEDKRLSSKALGKKKKPQQTWNTVCQTHLGTLAMNYSNSWIHCKSETCGAVGAHSCLVACNPAEQGREMLHTGCWALRVCKELLWTNHRKQMSEINY